MTSQTTRSAVIYDLQVERRKRRPNAYTATDTIQAFEQSSRLFTRACLEAWLSAVALGICQWRATGIPIPAHFMMQAGTSRQSSR